MANKNDSFMIWKDWHFPRGILHCLVLLTWQVEGLLQDQYVGCYNNSESTLYNDNRLTTEKCIMRCRTDSIATYAALQSGTMCNCIDDYGMQLPDDDCNKPCAGNQSQYCGGETKGNRKISAYPVSTVYTVCPVGNYSSACDKVCHCKEQIPCDRMTGNCPNGCDGHYSGSSCNTTSLSNQYIGCYKDHKNDRAMALRSYDSWQNTLELCAANCSNEKFSYAGTQYGSECFCGDRYDQHGEWKESICNITCNGNKSQICGGPDANSVYSVCPVGWYGNECRQRCNCLNNRRCIYRNGSCPLSQCRSGWTGTRCNIRDCTAYNGDCNQNETCSAVDLKFAKVSVCRCSEGFERRKLWENCIGIEAMEPRNIWPFVAIGVGSFLCLIIILLVVVVHLCRRNRENDESNTTGNVSTFEASIIRETRDNEEAAYTKLNRTTNDSTIYEEIP